ncbi:MAG: N4-gp56 family major capsid protein [Oscillospiraceae bacterium]|nr:N4-gp56 family major capsid protein [Oscillospiraceae bacterium]
MKTKNSNLYSMIALIFSLQLFADGGGALVNATGNYVNAYTGDTTPFSGNNTLSPEMKTFYDKSLLENSRPLLIHAQFGRKQSIPKGRGKTIEWRKFNTLPNATALTEGVIPTGQKLGVSYLTDEVGQYGMYVAISDVLELTAIDPVVMEAQEELVNSAGNTVDELVRNDIVAGTNVLYAQKVVDSALTDVTSRYALDATAKLTPDMVNRARTILKKMNAPTVDGDYVAIVHPSVVYDLTSSKDWVEVHKYSDAKTIFEGEIGKLYGVRFVETTQAKIIKGADLASDSRTLSINYVSGYSGAITSVAFDGGTVAAGALVGRKILINGVQATVTANTDSTITFASTNFGSITDNTVIYPGEGGAGGTAVFCTMFLAKEPFGTVDLEGGALEMIAHSKNDGTGGPLNQFSTVGYKLTSNGAKILYEDRMLRVESGSSYSEVDVEN